MKDKYMKCKKIAGWYVAVYCIAMLTGCTMRNHEVAEYHPVKVKVIVAEDKQGTSTNTYIGTVKPSKTALISSSYPGTLVAMNVSQGSQVKKGDIIAVIESQSVESSREMAYTTLKQAEDGYNRLSQVHKSGSLEDVKMVEIETQLSKARAAAKAADKAFEDCSIKAPFDGIIGETFVEQGVELSPMESIARILDISSVEITIPVPEKEINEIAKNNKMSVIIPALNYIEFPATIKSKGVTASPLSHTYKCTLTPVNNVPGLMPGMVCKVRCGNAMDAEIVLPASVVRTDLNGISPSALMLQYQTSALNIPTGNFETDGTISTVRVLNTISSEQEIVEDSILSFLRDLLISIAVVIAVMLMLFPFKSALIAGSSVPVCTAISIAVMYVAGINLNTVTLTGLIVVLGMIVDDSIIAIDGYMEQLGHGRKGTNAATDSVRELFFPMFTATLFVVPSLEGLYTDSAKSTKLGWFARRQQHFFLTSSMRTPKFFVK